MAKRCGTRNRPCSRKRAQWWLDALNGGGGSNSPSIQASLIVSNLANNSSLISWTNGNGDNRIVVISTSPVSNPTDGTNYTANTVFGSGSSIGSGYVVYKGTGNSVTVTNLVNGTTYYVAVFEANGTYFNASADTGNPTTFQYYNTQTGLQQMLGSKLVFAIEPQLTLTRWQEIATGSTPAKTNSVSDNDLVGAIQEIQNGNHILAPSTGTRPSLGLGTGRAAYFKHDGTNKWMTVINSLGTFKQLWGTNPRGTVAFWIKKSVDGTSMTWLNSQSATGGQTGILVGFTTGNKLQFWISKHSPNVTIINYTSTTSITVAMGWTFVTCELDGVGAGKFSMYINGVLDGTGTILAGVDQDASNTLRIGERNDGTADFNGHWGTLAICNDVLSTQERTGFGSYDPSVDNDLFPESLYHLMDFTSPAQMFTEIASPATNVSSNNDPIGTVKNKLTYSFGDLKRNSVAPSDAKRPLYKTNVKNGLPAKYADGDITFQELNHASHILGGCVVWWVVERFLNENGLNEGRHVVSGSPANNTASSGIYFTQTAYLDSSNTPPVPGYGTVAGDQYGVWHLAGVGTTVPGIKSGAQGSNLWNIYVFVQVGKQVTCYNHAGEKTEWPNTPGALLYTKIGGDAGVWDNNHVGELGLKIGIPGGRVSKQHAAVQELINSLKTKYAI